MTALAFGVCGYWSAADELPQPQQHYQKSEIEAIVVKVAEDNDLPPTTEEEPAVKEPPPAAEPPSDEGQTPKTKSDQKSEIEAAVFAAGSSSSGFFRRLSSLLYDILCAMPMIVCFGVPYFLLGCQNAALDQLMIKIGEFSSAFPRFMFYNWFAFFVYDWVFGIIFTTSDLADLDWPAGQPTMLAISWLSIAVSTAVLALRLFRLRPMMQKLGFSYDAPEAREEENIALAEEALALEQKLGTATTFAEDIPQAILTVITATKSDGGLSSTMAFSLISSCSASAYVVYDLAYKNLWNPEAGALIALFDATGGSTSWKNCQNWKSHKPISEWFGVEVDERGRVVKLALASNGLRGERL